MGRARRSALSKSLAKQVCRRGGSSLCRRSRVTSKDQTTTCPHFGSSRYAQRTLGVKSSAIRELLKVTQKPEIISFAGGLPAPDVFPVKRFEEACHKVLTEHGAQALQYGATEGYQPLREMIAHNIARYGIVANAENVLITSGSQQALDLIGKLLINRGDRILVEAPTYLGALQAFNVYGAQYVPVPVDDDGLLTDQLDPSLRAGPKFMYVLPNFQNPAGRNAFRRTPPSTHSSGRQVRHPDHRG